MAITATAVTNGQGSSTADATSYATASVSPTANRLLLLAVANGHTGGTDLVPSSVTGNGLTWVLVTDEDNGANLHISVWRAMGASPTAGAITINFGATQHNCLWSLTEFDGVDTSGTNGSGAIDDWSSDSGTGSTTASEAVGDVSFAGATYGAICQNSTSATITAGTGFALLGTHPSAASPANKLAVEWDVDNNNPVEFTVGSGVVWGMIAVAIAPDPPSFSTLSDNFDDNSLNATLWAETGAVTEESGQIKMTTAGVGESHELFTNGPYDLTGTRVFIQVVDAGDIATNNNWVVPLWLSDGAGGSVLVGIEKDGSDVEIYGASGDFSFITTQVIYNPAVHKFFGIRESGGTIFFEYSTNGSSWTSLGSDTAANLGISVTSLNLLVLVSDGGIAPEEVWFDNLNTLPAILAAATGSGTGGNGTVNAFVERMAAATGSGTGGNGTVSAWVDRLAAAAGSGLGGNATVAAFVERFVAAFGSGVGDGTAGADAFAFSPYAAPSALVYIETEADVWVELTADLIAGSTDRGRTNELDKYKTGTASLTFKDTTRKYDPVYSGSPLFGYLDVRHRMRIEAEQNNVTYPIFFGYIDDISPVRKLSNNLSVVTIKLSDFFKVLNKAAVNGTDFDSQLPGERIEEVLDLVDLDAGLRDIDDGETVLQAMTDVSSTLLSHLQTVAQTEFGDFFVKADGVVRFKSRDAALDEESQATIGDGPGEIHYNSLTPQYNDQLIRNPVSVDRVGGTKQSVEDAALNAPPPGGYGLNHYTLSGTYHDSDADALTAANYILGRYKLPSRRVVNLGFGPVPFAEGPTTYPHMLGRELTERVLVTERPMGVGSDIQQNSVIEGISHQFSPGKWVTRWNVSPGFASGDFWTLGVSELGSDTTLYF